MKRKNPEPAPTPGFVQWVSSSAASLYQAWEGFALAAYGYGDIFSEEETPAEENKTPEKKDTDELITQTDPQTAAAKPEDKNELGHFWNDGMHSGLLMLLPLLLEEEVIRPVAGALVHSTVSSNPWAEWAAVNLIDIIAVAILFPRLMNWGADAVARHFTAAKASAEAAKTAAASHEPVYVEGISIKNSPNQITKTPNEEALEPCPHDGVSHVTGSLFSLVHYLGARIALYFLAEGLPAGKYLTIPLKMLLYGRYFQDLLLAHAGKCEDDRIKIERKNNAEAMGIGAAFLAADCAAETALHVPEWLLRSLLGYQAGASGTGIYSISDFLAHEVVMSMLTLHFVMSVNLQSDKCFNGTETGRDYLWIFRSFTDWLAGALVEVIGGELPEVPADAEQNRFEDAKEVIQSILKKQPFKAAFDHADPSLRDWEKFAMRPTSQEFLKYWWEDINDAIAWVQEQRKRTDYNLANWAGNYWFTSRVLNFVTSPEDKRSLDILMLPEWGKPLQEARDFLAVMAHVPKSEENRTGFLNVPAAVPANPPKIDTLKDTKRVADGLFALPVKKQSIHPASKTPTMLRRSMTHGAGLFDSVLQQPATENLKDPKRETQQIADMLFRPVK